MDELSTGLVKARVAEVLWITQGRRHIKQAQAALAGYQTVPLNENTWWRGGEDCWGRALMLAPRLGKAGKDIADQLSNRLFEALDKEFEAPSPMLAPIAALVLENRVGTAKQLICRPGWRRSAGTQSATVIFYGLDVAMS